MKFFKQKRRYTNDKIFDNSFNKGEIEYEHFNAIEVDRSYSATRMNEFKNSFEYFETEELNKKIQNIYKTCEWRKEYKNRKFIPKHELPEMYNYFYEKVKNENFSDCDIFVAFADFLDLNYKTLYEMVPYAYRVNILTELDEKYQIMNKQKIRKLF